MIINSNNWTSPTRSIDTRAELYRDSALVYTFTKSNGIKSYKIERVGEEGKFFGFGISHKLTLILIDKDRVIGINKGDCIDIYMNTTSDPIKSVPSFYVNEINRNENTNEITITAFDKLYEASKYTVADLNLAPPYDLWSVLDACINVLGLNGLSVYDEYDSPIAEFLSKQYPNGANLEGTESIRDILNAISEITLSVYYLDYGNMIELKCLKYTDTYTTPIDKANYFTLETKEVRTLTSICHATELGDNLTASTGDPGETQYIRNNPFIETRGDIATILDRAISYIGGLTIIPYTCKWRGNFSLSPGDMISIVTKDDQIIDTYFLTDTLEYNGGLTQTSSIGYEESAQTESNPTTIGDAIKKTYAKVDKVNKEIEIVAGDLSTVKITTDNIVSSVTTIDKNLNDLSTTVSTKLSKDDVVISIEEKLADGVGSVITSTGFTFNEDGLHISKLNNEINTSITEDGLVINKDNTEVLKADNEGVKAIDLHATTYLIIGNNSRFENYSYNRTGCFWIGG